MMKILLKKSLVLSALIILTVYTVSSIKQNSWEITSFIWELVLTSLLICLVQLVMERFQSNCYLLDVAFEYIIICILISLAGLLLGWFELSYLWNVFLYVTPVYVVGYFLDIVKTRKDIDYINDRIKQRIERGRSHGQDDDFSEEHK